MSQCGHKLPIPVESGKETLKGLLKVLVLKGSGPWGTPRLRDAMTGHINRLFHPHTPLNSDDILFGAGVTAILDELGFVIASEGDAVLYSSPVYQSFKYDFLTKARYVDIAFQALGTSLVKTLIFVAPYSGS